MKNIVSYAKTYKNTNYEELSFSEVDGLILCQISYYDFALRKMDGTDFHHSVSEYLQADIEGLMKYLVTVSDDEELIKILQTGGRHGDLKVANYIEELDESCDQQFSAITFELPDGDYFIAFRGTDNSVIGWKEDFNMSFQNEIPSQKKAVRYAIDMMERYEGRFYLGGHSKGGNLAVYTAMMLSEKMQERLRCVYNYDGPGFLEEVYQNPVYKKIRPYIRKMVPQTSIVGMLLEEDSNYAVVKSSSIGFMQHNAFSWIVEEERFEILENVDAVSNLFKGTLNRWLQGMGLEERKQFVTIVFDIIGSMGISYLNEASSNRKEKARKLLEYLSKVDVEEKKMVFSVIGRFLQASAREMRNMSKRDRKKTYRL